MGGRKTFEDTYGTVSFPCPACKGTGQVRVSLWDSSSWKKDMFRAANQDRPKEDYHKPAYVTCPDCGGVGEVAGS